MSARIAAFVLWAATAAAVVYWALRVGVGAPAMPATVQPVSTAAVLRGDVLRLFTDPAVVEAPGIANEPGLASRFKLIGVMAPREGRQGDGQGIALIEIDGKPSRPYRVGHPVDESLVLQAVAARGVKIGPANGAPAVQLDLPPLPSPATGSLAADTSGLLSATRGITAPIPPMPPQQPSYMSTPESPPAQPMMQDAPVQEEIIDPSSDPQLGLDPSNRR